MNPPHKCLPLICLLLTAFLLSSLLSACSSSPKRGLPQSENTLNSTEPDLSRFLVVVDDEPDTVDFQCTSIYYTIAQNVFDRLVEMEYDTDGNLVILPSLAESWEISDDRCRYTFHLREGVTFSNGFPLTSSDVRYTLTRLLTNPESCNQSIAESIKGALRLESGETNTLEGIEILNDLDFIITLEQPFEAFLACLSMPGASIVDEETTKAAGNLFGTDPFFTIGTGSFILNKWDKGNGMLLVANPRCWAGAPDCEGVDIRFIKESESVRTMFENGELDILDLDDLDNFAEYYIHGDIYQDRLYPVQQIGITYIALNESIEPLNDVKVREALQLALNRQILLDGVLSGRGLLENGIYPHGLIGHNPDLPEIPFDKERAGTLLRQAGYSEGFDLTVTVRASSSPWELTLLRMASSMWSMIGVQTKIQVLDDESFMDLRENGALACYAATWTADFNDPDNFINTFFGSAENTAFRSLCYPDESVMERVRLARSITDAEARIREYQDLERIIVQEDAAWIPLFSRLRYYVISERTEGFRVSWNGSVKNNYRHMSVRQIQD